MEDQDIIANWLDGAAKAYREGAYGTGENVQGQPFLDELSDVLDSCCCDMENDNFD